MSILTNLEDHLKDIWAKLRGKVSDEAQAAETALLIFYKNLLASTAAHGPQYVQALKDGAEAGVAAAAAMPNATGAQKALAAAATAASIIGKEGLPVIENDIKGAVEAAYASFKQSNAPVVIPVPSPSA